MILEKENYLKGTIRDIVAVNPLVSIRKMQELVAHNTGYPISKNYTAKLIDKARKQAIMESDRKKANERLAEVRERFRVLTQYLSRVQYWKPEYHRDYGMPEPTFKEILASIKLIGQLELALLKAESIVGLFENKGVEVELTRTQNTTLRVGVRK